MTFHQAEKEAQSLSASSGVAYSVVALPSPSTGYYVSPEIRPFLHPLLAAIYARGVIVWPPTP